MVFLFLRKKAFNWLNTYIKKLNARKKNADDSTIEIINSYNKFVEYLKKYFRNADEIQTAKKILQVLNQTKLAASYTSKFKI